MSTTSGAGRTPRRGALQWGLAVVGWSLGPLAILLALVLLTRPTAHLALVQAAAHATATPRPRAVATPRPRPTPPPTLRLFVGPGTGVWAFVRGIDEARHRLLLQVGALGDGRVVQALRRASARGLDVRVLYDPTGMDGASLTALRAAGVMARPASAAFAATEQASLVVDSRYVLLSTGMLTPFALDSTRSFVVRDLDPLAVAQVAAVFYDDWLRRSPSLFVAHLVVAPPQVQSTVGHVIELAQATLNVSTRQLDDAGIAAALVAAMQRGVRVRLLTAGDAPLGRDVALVVAGLPVRRIGAPVARGTLIVEDDRRAYLSSVDLTTVGQTIERGLGVMVGVTPIVRTLRDTFAADWDAATIVHKPVPTVIPCPAKKPALCRTPRATPTPTRS